jgi:hypothetical protein
MYIFDPVILLINRSEEVFLIPFDTSPDLGIKFILVQKSRRICYINVQDDSDDYVTDYFIAGKGILLGSTR